jgi:hypothetical protein
MVAQHRLAVGAVEEIAGKRRESPADCSECGRRKGRPVTRVRDGALGPYREAV